MAKSHVLQNSFVSGELSPIVKGRTDLDQYYQGMETAENVVTVPQGGVKRRPGLKFVDDPVQTGNLLPPGVGGVHSANFPNGMGSPTAINDGNDATSSATTQTIGTTQSYIIAEYSFTGRQIGFIDVRNVALQGGSATDSVPLVIEVNTGGVWNQIYNKNITQNQQNFRVYADKYSAGVRILLNNVSPTRNLPNSTVFLSDFNVREKHTGSSSTVFIEPFEIGISNQYLMVFTSGNCRIFNVNNNTGSILLEQDLQTDLTFLQPASVAVNENVALLFGEHAPKRIVFNDLTPQDNLIQFAYDTPTFTNIPQFDFNDAGSPTPTNEIQVMTLTHGSGHNWEVGDRFQLDIEGVLSKNISFAGDDNADQRSSTVFNIQKNLQEMPIFGETGIAVARTGVRQYTITISGESTRAFELFSGFPTLGDGNNVVEFTKSQNGSPRSEDIWSAARGYPKSGIFTSGRLWLGGTRDKPQSILASKSGAFLDFLVKEGDDDEGIFVTINGDNNSITAISPDRGVQVFTSGSEYKLTGNTPGDVSLEQQTQYGSGSNVVSLDGATLFVDRNGRTLRQYVYNFNEDAYRSIDMSVLASHLIDKFPGQSGLAAAASRTSEDANFIFIINDDGTAVICNTLREQDIIGFTRINLIRPNGSSGIFRRVCTVGNRIFTAVQNGNDFTVCVFDEDHLMDESIQRSAPHSTTEAGFYHLAGQTVQVVIGNSVLPDREVNLVGDITLTTSEAALPGVLEVGKNFSVKVKTMPINSRAANSSQNALRQKRVDRMNLRVYESAGVSIDGNLVPVRSFGDSGNSPLNSSLVPTSGIIEDNNGGNGWDREVAPLITVDSPTPFHLQAISYEVSSS